MSESAVAEILRQLGAVSGSCADAAEIQTWAEACKASMCDAALDFVEKNSHRHILQQFSCDTTPVKVREQVAKLEHGTNRRSSNVRKVDFLVQFCSFSVLQPNDQVQNALVYRDPVLIRGRKTADVMISGALKCPMLLAPFGSLMSVKIRHMVLDRGVPAALPHYMSGRWMTSGDGAMSAESSGESRQVHEQAGQTTCESLHWHTKIGCCCHDIHNAFKWSMGSCYQDPEILKLLYNGIASAKNAFVNVLGGLHDALDAILSPCSASDLPTESDLMSLWLALEVDPELAQELASFRVWVADGEIKVLDECLRQKDFLTNFTRALLAAWSIKPFCGSRWLTVGTSCRSILLAWMTGYALCLQHVARRGLLQPSEWSAVQQLQTQGMGFVATASFSAILSENFLVAVMRDNRVARNLPAHLDQLMMDLDYLDHMDPFITGVVANMVCIEPMRFHDRVMTSALVQVAFMEYRIFAIARGLPWRLCAGDIDANISVLAHMSVDELESAHPIVRSITSLLSVGLHQNVLSEAVRLLAQAAWSSYLTEKFHASASTVRKFHPDLSPDMLLARSLLHQVRQMLPSVSAEQRQLQRLHKQWMVKLSKQEARITARHIFLADTMADRHRVNNARSQSGQVQLISARKVMLLHTRHFEGLSQAEKGALHHRALEKRRQLHDASSADIRLIEAEMEAIKKQAATRSQQRSTTMSFSTATMDQASLQSVQTHAADMAQDKRRVQKLRNAVIQEPSPMDSQHINFYRCRSRIAEDDARIRDRSEAGRSIIRNRDLFGQAVFGIPRASGELSWYRFMFATKQPYSLWLMGLDGFRGNVHHRDLQKITFAQFKSMRTAPTASWNFDATRMTDEDVFSGIDADDIRVYSDSMFVHGQVLLSASVCAPLIASLPPESKSQIREPPHKRARPHSSQAQPSEPLLQRYPWLAAYAPSHSHGPPPGVQAPADSPRQQEDEEHDVDENLESEFMQVFREHENDRVEGEGNPIMQQFTFSLMGGQWQKKRVGRDVYGWRVSARDNTVVHDFLSAFSLNLSASFEYSVYSQSGSSTMTTIWATRVAHLTEHWLHAGRPPVFPGESLPPFSCAELLSSLPQLPPRGRNRLNAILELLPL
eukprot:6458906-Amphidinium_carterae.1